MILLDKIFTREELEEMDEIRNHLAVTLLGLKMVVDHLPEYLDAKLGEVTA